MIITRLPFAVPDHPLGVVCQPVGDARRGNAVRIRERGIERDVPVRLARDVRKRVVDRLVARDGRVVGDSEVPDAELARHAGPWFAGQVYTALDAYVFTLCRWTRNFKSSPARERQHLGPYLKRVLERPAVQRVIANEKLAAPFI